MKKILKALTAALLPALLLGGLVTAFAAGTESAGIEVHGYVDSAAPTPTSAPTPTPTPTRPPYYPPVTPPSTPTPTTAPPLTPTPTSAPTVSPTVTPTATPTATPTEPGGDTKPPGPPGPANPGDSLVPKDDGYIEIDKDGVPEGEWHWDPDEGWVYEEYPDKDGPAKTGDTMPLLRYIITAVAALIAIALLLLTRKRRGDK